MPRRNKPLLRHQPFNMDVTCSSKKRYNYERQAQDVIEQRALTDINLVLSAYLCPKCSGWHLTRSQSKGPSV